ncbi:hypothetical protein BTJ68_06267 [Hortaea werneckii EXF-2000]|uniref:Uncharacterized protein n=2 Tax=Hortaea werneckii TaxID=91943 RepID=A0A3M7I7X5_HORWE|nr:hypothetical protein BTJ68_06267 [Hortaea werneckii EXF-2000]RMZ21604.1 hypothetical protein D0859_14380 [Hortaea werneckii]
MQAPVRGFVAGLPKASTPSSSGPLQSNLSTTSPAPHFDLLTSRDFASMRHAATAVTPDNDDFAASIKAQLVITTWYTVTQLLITSYSIDPSITYFRPSI